MKNLERSLEELKEIRELLVVIDMVNGFVKSGTLASPSIMRIVPRIRELLNKYLEKNNSKIVFVRDSHSANAEEFKIYGPHCIEGTKETEVIDELKFAEKDAYTYFKNSTNLVFADKFIHDLTNMRNLEKIDFCGCLSEVCVENGAISTRNLLDELNRNVVVGVHADAIDTYDAPGHERDEINQAAINRIKRNGVKIYKKGKM
ncbi:MAG: cysteine hydrolase [Bacilli bacterium]|nr:cysteine hydrolase [Bacilli bacterium]